MSANGVVGIPSDLSADGPAEATAPETYLVGKKDFNSFFVAVCRNGQKPERLEGFKSAELARSWVRQRVQSMQTPPAITGA